MKNIMSTISSISILLHWNKLWKSDDDEEDDNDDDGDDNNI